MQFIADVEAIFYFIGNKKNSIYQNYRPAHKIKKGYLTTGIHNYYNIDNSSNEIKGTITFVSPESYPACLWIGKRIEMYEGSKVVGYAIITQIFNPILDKENLHKR
ncbi:hypothetical protein [Candidatus Merdisoma sp. JLR.KK006]|uniref:hypothetical protein n=1 Tax=Candidatus Merdisoma sp. JLR.KK006 TaxID=3112626 RepID=UPI002FF39999